MKFPYLFVLIPLISIIVLIAPEGIAENRAHLRRLLNDRVCEGCDLRQVDLRNEDLREVNLRGAKLTNADLRGADLTNADLRGANLANADLRGANLTNTDLRGANLTNARQD